MELSQDLYSFLRSLHLAWLVATIPAGVVLLYFGYRFYETLKFVLGFIVGGMASVTTGGCRIMSSISRRCWPALVVAALTLLPVDAFAQMLRATLESMLKGDPQCSELRSAVLAELGTDLPARCEAAIDKACEGLKSGNIAAAAAVGREIAYACGEETGSAESSCVSPGYDEVIHGVRHRAPLKVRGAYRLATAVAEGRNMNQILEVYNYGELEPHLCIGARYDLIASAARARNWPLVRYFVGRGMPAQIAVFNAESDEDAVHLLETIPIDMTEKYPARWSAKRVQVWIDGGLLAYGIGRHRHHIIFGNDGEIRNGLAQVTTADFDYFLFAAKSGETRTLLYLFENGVAADKNSLTKKRRFQVLKTALANNGSGHEITMKNITAREGRSSTATTTVAMRRISIVIKDSTTWWKWRFLNIMPSS